MVGIVLKQVIYDNNYLILFPWYRRSTTVLGSLTRAAQPFLSPRHISVNTTETSSKLLLQVQWYSVWRGRGGVGTRGSKMPRLAA